MTLDREPAMNVQAPFPTSFEKGADGSNQPSIRREAPAHHDGVTEVPDITSEPEYSVPEAAGTGYNPGQPHDWRRQRRTP